MIRKVFAQRWYVLMLFVLSSCGSGTTLSEPTDVCMGYPEWSTSAYILPYQSGTAHEVIQGNCSPKNSIGTCDKVSRGLHVFLFSCKKIPDVLQTTAS